MQKVALLDEQKYYEQHKEDLLKQYRNKYVVIKQGDVLGGFAKQYDAYVAGIEKYGNEPILIKYVAETPEPPEQTPALWAGNITHNAT